MTVMTSWDLFDDLRSAQDELARMSRMPGQRPSQFSRFSHFTQQPGTAFTTQAWSPPVDITEREDAYLVSADLPGVSTGDVEITVQDGLLTIQGERHPASDAAGQNIHRAERRYGAFRRSMTLPSHVQADKIEASAQDGVLLVLVPKAVEAHAKRIAVRTGKGQPKATGSKVTGTATKTGTAAKNGA
jgi:HSP20 family protein